MNAMARFSKGQMKMGLAAQLHSGGLDASVAMTAAMEIIDAMKTPPKWRDVLGAEVSNAIDDDLLDPRTWTK